MVQIDLPRFSSESPTNIGCVRRCEQLREMARNGDLDGIANFSTSRTRANYAQVADYRESLLAIGRFHMEGGGRAQETIRAASTVPPPRPVIGSNPNNTALVAAQRKINLIYRSAMTAADPVAELLAITTSRGNGYLNAADDYRTAMLNYFGYRSDGEPVPNYNPEVLPTGTATPAPTPPPRLPPLSTRRATPAPTPPPLAPGVRRAVNPIPGSANPLNMTEEELGFVPRPDMPLSYYLAPNGYHRTRAQSGPLLPYANDEQQDLARRYLNSMQGRAREYQAGTWRPDGVPLPTATPAPTPPPQIVTPARMNAQQRADIAAMRRAAASTLRKIDSNAVFKPTKTPGANIHQYIEPTADDQRKIEQVMGLPFSAVKAITQVMIADYGDSTTFKTSFNSIANGQFYVSFSGRDGTSISRRFTRQSDGTLHVYHSYFEAGDTGAESGKGLFRTSMGAYRALGVKTVTVSANIDVGGYAWARFGYKPKTQGIWDSLRSSAKYSLDIMKGNGFNKQTHGRTTRFNPLTDAEYHTVKRILENPDPTKLWDLADCKVGGKEVGKALLLGTGWGGIIDLADKATMKRFTNYVKPRTARTNP
jgi:hypothetical protein